MRKAWQALLMSLLVLLTAGCSGKDSVTADGQHEGCAAEPGSATDLASEPAGWLSSGGYHRWTDLDGCKVRVG